MTGLDAEKIRAMLGDATRSQLASLEVFESIDSTNSYLMRQSAPEPGHLKVAVTDNQTAGRGRHGRTWQSPPGAGIALSIAFSFASIPANLPGLTLAIGLGVIRAMEGLEVGGVQLKWPNDLVAGDGKLGGILTEAQTQAGDAVTVISGIGLNIDLGAGLDLSTESGWVQRAVDLKTRGTELPATEAIAGRIVDELYRTILNYEKSGLAPVLRDWQTRDWLFGRDLAVETAGQRVTGIGAGIGEDGALLVDTAAQGIIRITSGTVVMAGSGEHAA